MKLDQLPSTLDYVMTAPASMIILLISPIATIIFLVLLFIFLNQHTRTRTLAFLFVGFFVSLIASAFSIQASSDGLARFRGEVVSEHLKETYDVDVSFTEDGVQPTNLDGLTVYDNGSVYRITVAADDSILLVDDGGREVPRVDQ